MKTARQAFGKLGAASRPLEFSDKEQKSGLKAAGTMDRLAGSDGVWDKDDLPRNYAQLYSSKSKRFDGIKKPIAFGQLMDAHGVPKSERAGIRQSGRQLLANNPDAAELRELKAEVKKTKDPAKREAMVEQYKEMATEVTANDMLPISVSSLENMGEAADTLKGKLKERGLDAPEGGGPVYPAQFRGIYEGKSPLRAQLGL